ncbi:hypothetical protein ABZ192_40510 [Streptomyces sp. NPDC006235]|uniref:hypothetical protein n=1 Tax=Streptomyces sp. NPDC006235 TaxID=3156736 RepID=UPI0033BC338E
MTGALPRGHASALAAAGLATGVCFTATTASAEDLGGVAVPALIAVLALGAGAVPARLFRGFWPRHHGAAEAGGPVVALALLGLSIVVACPGRAQAAAAQLALTGLVTGFLTGLPLTDPERGTSGPARAARSVTWSAGALAAGCAAAAWQLPEARGAASALACCCALLLLTRSPQVSRPTLPRRQ